MISNKEAFRTWLKIGLLSFGGPAGQIALMHKVLVEEKNWISETRFLHALNYCMLLPGPEAMQLATYIGWLLHKTRGGLVAGLLFILPGCFLMMGLSAIYAAYHNVPFVGAIFFGLKPAVLVIVVEALLRIGKRALTSEIHKIIACLSFIGIFFFSIPFPLIIVAAGLAGFAANRYAPKFFGRKAQKEEKHAGNKSVIDKMFETGKLAHAKPDKARAVKTLALGLLLWLAPVAGLFAAQRPACAAPCFEKPDVFAAMALFFSKMAVVTFGGAYAVLSYVAQIAVGHYQWLTAGDMLNGLGLAETTPGPLILVLQYVGYLAAFNAPGALPPHLAGLLGAVLVLWVTFVPCFLWIFLGGPYVETLRTNKSLPAALSAVTAAVTGVILNLAVWFALHVLFERGADTAVAGMKLYMPDVTSISLPACMLSALAVLTTFKLKWNLPATLGACAVIGLVIKMA